MHRKSAAPPSGADAGFNVDSECARGLPDIMLTVYEELREIAARYLRRERPGHTLQATAVLHEAYMRLAELDGRCWASRTDFCAAASQAIRRVLIDHARARRAAKRGGSGARRVPLDASLLTTTRASLDLLAVDEALSRLAILSERQARIVELRFFGGLSEADAAHTLAISRRTAQKDWRFARARLLRELGCDA